MMCDRYAGAAPIAVRTGATVEQSRTMHTAGDGVALRRDRESKAAGPFPTKRSNSRYEGTVSLGCHLLDGRLPLRARFLIY